MVSVAANIHTVRSTMRPVSTSPSPTQTPLSTKIPLTILVHNKQGKNTNTNNVVLFYMKYNSNPSSKGKYNTCELQ